MPLSCAIQARPKSTTSDRRSRAPTRVAWSAHAVGDPGARAQRSGEEEDDQGARGDKQAANRGVGGLAGLEHEGNGEDRCHVGDRNLGDYDQRLWAVELSFLQHRQHDRRGARGQQNGIDGDMTGPS